MRVYSQVITFSKKFVKVIFGTQIAPGDVHKLRTLLDFTCLELDGSLQQLIDDGGASVNLVINIQFILTQYLLCLREHLVDLFFQQVLFCVIEALVGLFGFGGFLVGLLQDMLQKRVDLDVVQDELIILNFFLQFLLRLFLLDYQGGVVGQNAGWVLQLRELLLHLRDDLLVIGNIGLQHVGAGLFRSQLLIEQADLLVQRIDLSLVLRLEVDHG